MKVATGKNIAGKAEMEGHPPARQNPAKAMMGGGRHNGAGMWSELDPEGVKSGSQAGQHNGM